MDWKRAKRIIMQEILSNMEIRANQLTRGMRISLDGEFAVIRKISPINGEYIRISLDAKEEAIIVSPDEKFVVFNLFEVWQDYEKKKQACRGES